MAGCPSSGSIDDVTASLTTIDTTRWTGADGRCRQGMLRVRFVAGTPPRFPRPIDAVCWCAMRTPSPSMDQGAQSGARSPRRDPYPTPDRSGRRMYSGDAMSNGDHGGTEREATAPPCAGSAAVQVTGMRAGLPMILLLVGLTVMRPLSMDMYLPALRDAAADIGSWASGIQLTLTACLAGLALDQLVAGPMSDRCGAPPSSRTWRSVYSRQRPAAWRRPLAHWRLPTAARAGGRGGCGDRPRVGPGYVPRAGDGPPPLHADAGLGRSPDPRAADRRVGAADY